MPHRLWEPPGKPASGTHFYLVQEQQIFSNVPQKCRARAADSDIATLGTDRHGRDSEDIFRPLVSNLHPMFQSHLKNMLVLCRVIVSIV